MSPTGTRRAPSGEPDLDALAEALASSRRTIEAVAARIARVRRQLGQLSALRASDGDAAVLDRLDAVLDVDRVRAHVLEAIVGSPLVSAPVPHLVIADLWPADVHHAIVEAVPSPAFFTPAGSALDEMSLPPVLAPVPAIAAWQFVVDFTKRVIAPALVDRFRIPLEERLGAFGSAAQSLTEIGLGASRHRIVMRSQEFVDGMRRGGSELVAAVVCLDARGTPGSFGSRLQRVAVFPGSVPEASYPVPFRPNSALVYLIGPGGHAYESIPAGHDAIVRTYEFQIVAKQRARSARLGSSE